MKAVLLIDERVAFEDGSFVEMTVRQVPQAVPPCRHGFKYSFAYIAEGQRIVGYDNERGKGDHRHRGGRESVYVFETIEELMADFLKDVRNLRGTL
jgi:hypothetical protein